MQCMGNLGCFHQGKQTALVQRCPAFFKPFVQCFHTTSCEAYSFTATDGYGIFNVRTILGVWCTHEGGSGTNESAQELTQRDRKIVFQPAR